MNMLIRLYNQNRAQLYRIIFIISAVIFAIHFSNYLVKQSNEEKLENVKNSISTQSSTNTYKNNH